MKYSINVIFLTILSAAFLTNACQHMPADRNEIDESLPGVLDLTYDEDNSSDNSVAVYWDYRPAMNAGATSFTIQLVKDEKDNAGDVYTNTSNTFEIAGAAAPGATVFTKLTKLNRYYVRGRANYPGSVRSGWTYMFRTDTDALAVIQVGTGLFDGPITTITTCSARLARATSSTLSFKFTSTDGKDLGTDADRTYNLKLYKDKDCSDLHISWRITPASGARWSSSYPPSFMFSGLDPAMTYYFKVVDETDEAHFMESELIEAKTLPSFVKTIDSEPVPVGETILYEDFSELVWGGSMLDQEDAAGYSSKNRGTMTSLMKASGVDPLEGPAGFYICQVGQDMGFFSTLGLAIPSTRLAGWGHMSEAGYASAVCAQAGHLKLGTSAYSGVLVTPPLTNLKETATVEVSFDAMNPVEGDQRDMGISIINNATINEFYVTADASDIITKNLQISDSHKMEHYSVTLPNVKPGARIGVGGNTALKTTKNRVFFDNLELKVLSYGTTAITLSAPTVSAEAPAGSLIVASWNAVENASAYQVEYKKSSDADWTVAGTTASTTCRITGLSQLTSYDVRVKAIAGESASEYSNVATLSTPRQEGGISIQNIFTEPRSIGIKWSKNGFSNMEEDALASYKVGIYTNAACTELLWQWAFGTKGLNGSVYCFSSNGKENGSPLQPGYLFSGLAPATDYWIKVTDADSGVSTTEKYTTASDTRVNITTTAAKAGETVLYNDFDDLKYGGEPVHMLAGYSSTTRGTDTEFVNPSGEVPGSPCYLIYPYQDMGMFGTLKNALPNTSFKGWGAYTADNGTGGLCAMGGLVKFGGGNKQGYLVTPPLTCLQKKATLEIILTCATTSGNAACYASVLPGTVQMTSGSEFMIDVTVASNAPVKESAVQTVTGTWTKYTCTLTGVEPGQRVGVGSSLNAGAGERLYMDNIQIKLLNYE